MKNKLIFVPFLIIVAIVCFIFASTKLYKHQLDNAYSDGYASGNTNGYNTGKSHGENNPLTKVDAVFYLDSCTTDNHQYFVIILSNGNVFFLTRDDANDPRNDALIAMVNKFLAANKTPVRDYVMDNDCV